MFWDKTDYKFYNNNNKSINIKSNDDNKVYDKGASQNSILYGKHCQRCMKTLLNAKLFIFLAKFNKRYKKMVGMSFTEEKQNCVIVSSVAASFVRACTN